MKFYILLSFLLVTLNVHGQNDTGAHFEKLPDWQAVLAQAKAGHKMIFVDCYATWCGPCKMMDKVYANDTVGAYMNKRFISIKLQMATSRSDDALVKSWYK